VAVLAAQVSLPLHPRAHLPCEHENQEGDEMSNYTNGQEVEVCYRGQKWECGYYVGKHPRFDNMHCITRRDDDGGFVRIVSDSDIRPIARCTCLPGLGDNPGCACHGKQERYGKPAPATPAEAVPFTLEDVPMPLEVKLTEGGNRRMVVACCLDGVWVANSSPHPSFHTYDELATLLARWGNNPEWRLCGMVKGSGK
jgi:hypothetical protein